MDECRRDPGIGKHRRPRTLQQSSSRRRPSRGHHGHGYRPPTRRCPCRPALPGIASIHPTSPPSSSRKAWHLSPSRCSRRIDPRGKRPRKGNRHRHEDFGPNRGPNSECTRPLERGFKTPGIAKMRCGGVLLWEIEPLRTMSGRFTLWWKAKNRSTREGERYAGEGHLPPCLRGPPCRIRGCLHWRRQRSPFGACSAAEGTAQESPPIPDQHGMRPCPLHGAPPQRKAQWAGTDTSATPLRRESSLAS